MHTHCALKPPHCNVQEDKTIKHCDPRKMKRICKWTLNAWRPYTVCSAGWSKLIRHHQLGSPTNFQKVLVVWVLSSLARYGHGPSWSPVTTVCKNQLFTERVIMVQGCRWVQYKAVLLKWLYDQIDRKEGTCNGLLLYISDWSFFMDNGSSICSILIGSEIFKYTY